MTDNPSVHASTSAVNSTSGWVHKGVTQRYFKDKPNNQCKPAIRTFIPSCIYSPEGHFFSHFSWQVNRELKPPPACSHQTCWQYIAPVAACTSRLPFWNSNCFHFHCFHLSTKRITYKQLRSSWAPTHGRDSWESMPHKHLCFYSKRSHQKLSLL